MPKDAAGVYDISLTEPWYLEHPVDGKEGDENPLFTGRIGKIEL